jgi:hypothetical protein
MNKYVVTVETPKGVFDVELIASSAELAGKRAWLSLVQARYGDVDEVIVVSTVEGEFAEEVPA